MPAHRVFAALAMLIALLGMSHPALASRCNNCRRSGGYNPLTEIQRVLALGGGGFFLGRRLMNGGVPASSDVALPEAASGGRRHDATPSRALLASARYDQCTAAFNAAGGEAQLTTQVPSCLSQGSFSISGCCAELNKIYNSEGAFKGCLCDADVWAYVAGRTSAVGVAGVNENTLGTFLNSACRIPNYRGGGC